MHKLLLQGACKYRSVHFVTYQKWKILLGREKLIVYKQLKTGTYEVILGLEVNNTISMQKLAAK